MVESIAVLTEPSRSKRSYIPKPDGKRRPLGIAALEDKVVQQAARTVLESLYEQDFLGLSYGFRPGQSCHRALDALYVGISGQARKGDFTILRRTSRKKFQAKLLAIKTELSRRSHHDLALVGRWLRSVFQGWVQYHAVPGNSARLQQFQDAIQAMWLRALRRRSQRGRPAGVPRPSPDGP